MKQSILLVSPFSDNEALWVTGDETAEVKNNFPPLGLATIAGLTPVDEFDVHIWDEIVHGLISEETEFDYPIDIVGVTGYSNHMARCVEISRVLRNRGILVVAGGPGVSSSPHTFRKAFDVLFINEAEYTWPEFLRDWKTGEYKAEYRQIDKPDMNDSPMPRWTVMAEDMKHYAMGNVQTTRGCPFDCEFCDVIYLFGRRQRHKPVERVVEEVRIQAAYGLRTIFFSDDEFSGNRRYAKELLRALIALNDELPERLTFSTQISLSIHNDKELMELLAEANFDLVFVGIESASEESLKGANKKQNLKGGTVTENVKSILSYGIGIRGGMIVGFDEDDTSIFNTQFQFIQESALTSFGIFMLKAPLGTKLWQRLMREGRVLNMAVNKKLLGHPRSYTNIFPKQMTRIELMEGFHDLLKEAYSWPNFADRVCKFVSRVNYRPTWLVDTGFRIDRNALVAQLSGGEEMSAAVEKIVSHTESVAPHLSRKVRTLILQHGKYHQTIQGVLPQILRQIELEKAGRLTLKPDNRMMPPSKAVRAAFDQVFPELHREIYVNLEDKKKVPAALTEVFVDFFVRWGEDFEELEDHHIDFLQEIAARTCASFNGRAPETFAMQDASAQEVPDVKKSRLGDDVFKNVWLEITEIDIKKKTDLSRWRQTEQAVPAPETDGQARQIGI